MSNRPAHSSAPRRLVVPTEAHARRLDQVLAEWLVDHSRTRIKSWIEAGAVTIDGVPAERASQALVAGSVVEVTPQEIERKIGGTAQIRVLFDDPDFALVDKPAGVICHPSESVRGGTVSEQAEALWGSLPDPRYSEDDEDHDRRPGIVHRLDARTSGVMVVAKTELAAQALVAQFAARQVKKTYVAIVFGTPRFVSDWIETPIGRDARHSDRMSVVREGDGRTAETYYEVRERFDGCALLEVQPRTGRTHQIRVHLESIELPIIGDPLYRGRHRHRELPKSAPRIDRQALHAARIEFAHPRTGATVVGEAPLADDMQALLEWLRVNAPLVQP
jgi:23S rRNA pseudouridine1911/1915/1917 synthase